MRGLMIPQKRWPHRAAPSSKRRWTEYKRALGLLDFTDLIETCYRDVYAAPRQSGRDLRGRGAGPQPDAVDAHPEVGRARGLLHRCGRRRPDHLFVHGRVAGRHSSTRTFRRTTRSSSNSRYRVPRAVHRLADESDPTGHPPAGEGIPAATGGRRGTAALARRLQVAGVLHPQERRWSTWSRARR